MFLGLERFDSNRVAAIDDRGGSITYGCLMDTATKVGETIPSSSVAFLLCENTASVLSAYIALMENGIVPLMLDKNMDGGGLEALMETYEPAYLVVPEDVAGDFGFQSQLSLRGISYLSTGYKPYPIHKDLEILLTTSGSTGSPKLVRHKKGNIEASAKMVAESFGWTEKERPACSLPMNYTMGLNIINTHLYVGATLLLITSNIMSASHWNFMRDNRATNFTGVPFSYDIMFKMRILKKEWPDLMAFSEGGGRLTEDLFIKMAEYAQENGKKFFASFGTTETTSRISLLSPEFAGAKTCSIGKALKGGELFLVDPEGEEVVSGNPAEGELVYRGPNVTMGYGLSKSDLELGDEFMGVYRTGDLARRDEEGFYYIIGRKSRFLKLLGHRVDLDECEKILRKEYGIYAACTGDDNEMIVVLETEDDNLDPLDVADFMGKKIGISANKFKVFLRDNLPRNSYGKILYAKLKAD